MAARRTPTAEPDPTLLWLPACLRAGKCGDVWAADLLPLVHDEESWLTYVTACTTRYGAARQAWFTVHGLNPQRRDPRVPDVIANGSAPWSYRAAASRGTLIDVLQRRGLPLDWRPSPAPRSLLRLDAYGPPNPEAVRVLTEGQ